LSLKFVIFSDSRQTVRRERGPRLNFLPRTHVLVYMYTSMFVFVSLCCTVTFKIFFAAEMVWRNHHRAGRRKRECIAALQRRPTITAIEVGQFLSDSMKWKLQRAA